MRLGNWCKLSYSLKLIQGLYLRCYQLRKFRAKKKETEELPILFNFLPPFQGSVGVKSNI